MSVTRDEYVNIIEPMYMAADVDKDEFCRLWVKMNHKRVADAIKARKEAEEEQQLKDRLFRLYNAINRRCNKLNQSLYLTPAEEVLNSREKELLQSIGIETDTKWVEWIKSPIGGYYSKQTALDIRYELHQKYNFA